MINFIISIIRGSKRRANNIIIIIMNYYYYEQGNKSPIGKFNHKQGKRAEKYIITIMAGDIIVWFCFCFDRPNCIERFHLTSQSCDNHAIRHVVVQVETNAVL